MLRQSLPAALIVLLLMGASADSVQPKPDPSSRSSLPDRRAPGPASLAQAGQGGAVGVSDCPCEGDCAFAEQMRQSEH